MKTITSAFAITLVVVLASGCVVHDRGYHRNDGGQSHGAAPVGGASDHQLVCHKGKKTLSLPPSAVDAHLGHGDRRGAC